MKRAILFLSIFAVIILAASCGPDKRKATSFFNMANAQADNKDYPAAITNYSLAIKMYPDFIDAYYGRAAVEIMIRDSKGAIADYTKIISLRPTDKNAYFGRGKVKYDGKDLNGAIADFTKAIEMDSGFAEAYADRAMAEQENGMGYAAMLDNHVFLKIVKDSIAKLEAGYTTTGQAPQKNRDQDITANEYYQDASRKAAIKDYTGAIAGYSKVIELQPSNANLYVNRANAKDNLKDYNGAIEDCNKALAIESDCILAYFSRGRAEYNLKNYEQAAADLEKGLSVTKVDNNATEANRKVAEIYLYAGVCNIHLNRKERACADFDSALRLGDARATLQINKYCK